METPGIPYFCKKTPHLLKELVHLNHRGFRWNGGHNHVQLAVPATTQQSGEFTSRAGLSAYYLVLEATYLNTEGSLLTTSRSSSGRMLEGLQAPWSPLMS